MTGLRAFRNVINVIERAAFLQPSGKLLALAVNHIQLVFGQLSLALLDLALVQLQRTFHPVPVHLRFPLNTV